ncbi:MAG TPA: cation transporter [Leucothrix mucor]|uniref:Cation transporter n=1 Tax=Leucothrix mucor TaxID=45248 RepID=A0A7V2T1D5_LEUMU|nr:cation transporter [Leucothrix mucor]
MPESNTDLETSTIKYTNKQRYEATHKVTLTGIIINILLSVAQLIGGFFAHSQALIADGLHTLSDLASDFVVLYAAKLASKDADEEHPYGHERIETVATVILGMALAGVAVGIGLSALDRLLHPENLLQPSALAILFALVAIIAKEGLYQYTNYIANQVNSNLLRANALHHRSDAISSLFVMLGVASSVLLQIPWLDAVAAILVAIMIFYMGARLILDSTMELVDTAVELNKVSKVKEFISSLEGVDSLHLLRTRKMGSKVLADVHIQVNSYLTVSEGHYIAESVMNKTRIAFPEMTDITVHIDPENDEIASSSAKLPSRSELMKQLYPFIQESGLANHIRNIVLHYLEGKIDIEIYLKGSLADKKAMNLVACCEDLKSVRKITLYQAML